MKMQWIKNAAFLLLIGTAAPVFAQENGGGPEKGPLRGMPSPEENAQRISTEMKEALGLTDEQCSQMCALYLKAQQASMPGNAGGPGMPPQGGMGVPPEGGPEMGGGMPPQGGMQPGGNFPPKDMEEMIKQFEEARRQAYDQLDADMKDVLDGDVYEQWKSLETERRNQEAQMMPRGPRPDAGQEPAANAQ